MADDRIDEAIAAVVRAVDRIEAATRGVAEDPPVLPEQSRLPRKPPPPSFTAMDLRGAGGFAARPTTSLGRSQPPVEPDETELEVEHHEAPELEVEHHDAPELEVEHHEAPKLEVEHHDAPSPDLWPEASFYESQRALQPPVPRTAPPDPESVAPQAPHQPQPPAAPQSPMPPVTPPVPSYDALGPTGDDEVHELVGRIVARTQHLEDQLELARHLRFEITELVRRLAAAVERDR